MQNVLIVKKCGGYIITWCSVTVSTDWIIRSSPFRRLIHPTVWFSLSPLFSWTTCLEQMEISEQVRLSTLVCVSGRREEKLSDEVPADKVFSYQTSSPDCFQTLLFAFCGFSSFLWHRFSPPRVIFSLRTRTKDFPAWSRFGPVYHQSFITSDERWAHDNKALI